MKLGKKNHHKLTIHWSNQWYKLLVFVHLVFRYPQDIEILGWNPGLKEEGAS